jgi:hypothetical protein
MTELPHYTAEAEIEEVVRRFESCEYATEEFFHARHLTVAAWYFLQFDGPVARERMRAGLVKFISHHGRHGFNETITEFWLRMVEDQIRATRGTGRKPVAIVNEIVSRLGDKSVIYLHYSREKLESAEAKAGCVMPDLKPLPGGSRPQLTERREINS